MCHRRNTRTGRPAPEPRRAPLRPAAAALALAIAGWALVPGGAGAVPIPPSAVDKTAVLEGFEGLVAGGEVGAQAGMTGVLLPGATGPYTFASGLVLFGPNTYVFPNDAFVHELGGAAPPNDWGANGVVDDAGDVPFGTAYLGVFEAGSASAEVRFFFPDPVDMVGAFVAGAAGTDITLEVYDAAGALLESVTLAAPSVGDWGSSFLGIERTEGIASAVFRGNDFGVDQVYFDLMAVPEPGTLALVALGLAALATLRRR